MSAPKIIKRYANRKLYDTERSCYVTLDDIASMIKTGDEVRVVDNKSSEDLTSVTLAQIIFEAEKKDSFMPMALLRDLIQNGGDAVGELYRERVEKVQAAAHDIKTKAQTLRNEWEGKIGGVMRKGDGPDRPEEGEALLEADDTESSKAERSKILADLGELLESSQRAFDDLQRGVEERIKGGVGNLSRYTHLGRDMEEIRQRLEALEQRLEKLQH